MPSFCGKTNWQMPYRPVSMQPRPERGSRVRVEVKLSSDASPPFCQPRPPPLPSRGGRGEGNYEHERGKWQYGGGQSKGYSRDVKDRSSWYIPFKGTVAGDFWIFHESSSPGTGLFYFDSRKWQYGGGQSKQRVSKRRIRDRSSQYFPFKGTAAGDFGFLWIIFLKAPDYPVSAISIAESDNTVGVKT